MTEKKTSKNILLAIMGVLVLVEIVSRLCCIGTNTLQGVLLLISLAFVALYGFWFYKKPHGNMLKIAMLLFAAAGIISNIAYLMSDYPDYASGIIILACAALCYGAGRLNRVEQNKILFPVIDIVLIVCNIWCLVNYNDGSFLRGIAFFDFSIIMTTLMIAYFTRYKEHREAGLQDAPKK